jgi:hypothetical protein
MESNRHEATDIWCQQSGAQHSAAWIRRYNRMQLMAES